MIDPKIVVRILLLENQELIVNSQPQGLSNRAIGRQLVVNHQTINNELNRGTVRQLRRQKSNGKIYCILQNRSTQLCNIIIHSCVMKQAIV